MARTVRACEPRPLQAHFVSRKAMDVDGLGRKSLADLYERGMVRRPSDLFTLEQRDRAGGVHSPAFAVADAVAAPLATWDGWGEVSARNLFDAIRAVQQRATPLHRLLLSLGVSHMGQAAAALVADHFRTPDALIAYLRTISAGADAREQDQALEGLKGVGPKLIRAIHAFAARKENVLEVESLVSQLRFADPVPTRQVDARATPSSPSSSSSSSSRPLDGQKVLFSGTMESYTREEARALAALLGGTPVQTMTKHVTAVVLGARASRTKMQQAESQGARIITEAEFTAMAAQVQGSRSA
jgi:DNA ligase (NAD+)